MKLLTVAATAGLLLSLVSCGNDSGSKSRKPAIDQLVTSANWKIVLEGRSFPSKAVVTVNDEVVVNECADKQSYFINREENPQNLPMANYKVPQGTTVKIEVDDCTGTESALVPAADFEYEMTKNGSVAEVLVRI